ncbi:hypothetical protein [Motiliproteus sp.]|uniref:hypothetical protein n=1 Tax=Motiliproteus sp. TaxID=1898955 RepID=UPI003BA9407C
MTTSTLLLILASAVLHASWNLIGKKSAQSVAFYAWAMAAGMLIFSPLAISVLPYLPQLNPEFWGLLLLSGLFQALYLTGLAQAYRHGNLGLVYPLARALPVLLVPLAVLLIYGQTRLDTGDGLGMLMIAGGALGLPLARWRELRLQHYCTPAIGWVLLAAASTAGYSLTDSAAVQHLNRVGLSAFEAGSSFVVLQAGCCLLWLVPIIHLLLRQPLTPTQPRMIWLAGSFVIGTYLLILTSMTLVDEVSYVVALRQASIPIGVLIGVFWLGEPLSRPRLTGLLLMLAGLLMVAL